MTKMFVVPPEKMAEIKKALFFGMDRLVRSGESPMVTDPLRDVLGELDHEPFTGFPEDKLMERWKALYFGTDRLVKQGESPMVTEPLRELMRIINVIHRDELDKLQAMEKDFSEAITNQLPQPK